MWVSWAVDWGVGTIICRKENREMWIQSGAWAPFPQSKVPANFLCPVAHNFHHILSTCLTHFSAWMFRALSCLNGAGRKALIASGLLNVSIMGNSAFWALAVWSVFLFIAMLDHAFPFGPDTWHYSLDLDIMLLLTMKTFLRAESCVCSLWSRYY